ncbi:hypothetical protein WKH52_12380 [Pantoea agglomerans]|uniref:hypothetical protein n=1 Tax=Enterobacter agglomerans TaxID=549 RepID=UPI003C7BE0F4
MTQYVWILSVISIVLVLIGWRVVYYNAKRLATRSETKSLIDNTISTLSSISDSAVNFWLSDAADEEKKDLSIQLYTLNISAKLKQASNFFQFLKHRGVEVEDSLLAEINDKCTLDCEKVHQLDVKDSAVRAQEAMEKCSSAIEHVFLRFESTHPPTSPKSLTYKFRDLGTFLDDWSKNLGPKPS